MKLLETLASVPEAGVTELSSNAGMHKSTTYRFLSSLCKLGYVRKNETTDRYGATLKLFALGTASAQHVELWREARPPLEQLAHETHETVHLAALEDGKLVYLHKIESTRNLRVSMMSRVGNSAPLHCTGLGKCLLAFSPPEVTERIVDGLPLERYTDYTLTSPTSLRRELKEIVARGYAVDNEEHERGVRCIAAPITGPGGVLLASTSISVPSVRLPESDIESQALVLLRTTRRITAGLRHDVRQP